MRRELDWSLRAGSSRNPSETMAASGDYSLHLDYQTGLGPGLSSINRIEDVLGVIRDKQGSELIRQRIRSLIADPGKVIRFCMMRWRRRR